MKILLVDSNYALGNGILDRFKLRFLRFSNKLEVVKDFFTPTSNYDILSLKDPGPIVISTFFPNKNSSDEEQRIENSDFFLKKSNVDNNIISKIY